ncbi:XRE family transcriptional regulator [Enterococcus faecalis]|nr:XRE family transcriptional regulator [Enterococcus faecalis]
MAYKYVEFANYFKEKRKKIRLSQQELADKAEISKSAISGVETGRFLPSVETIRAVAKVLNVSEEELLSKKDEVTKKVKERESITRIKPHSHPSSLFKGRRYDELSEYDKMLISKESKGATIFDMEEVENNDYVASLHPDEHKAYSEYLEGIEQQVQLQEIFRRLTIKNQKQLIDIAKIFLQNQ